MRRNEIIDQEYCFAKVDNAQKSEGNQSFKKYSDIENSADEIQIPEHQEEEVAGNYSSNLHYPSRPHNQNPLCSSDETSSREDFAKKEQPQENDPRDHNFKSSRVAQASYGHQNLQEEDSKNIQSPEDIWQIYKDDGV